MSLSADSLLVLRAILAKRLLRGREFLDVSKLSPERFVLAVVPLMDKGIVDASFGFNLRVETSRFSLSPSGLAFAIFLVQQATQVGSDD